MKLIFPDLIKAIEQALREETVVKAAPSTAQPVKLLKLR
jgi:hypothetical protein